VSKVLQRLLYQHALYVAVILIAGVPLVGSQHVDILDEARRLFYNAQYRASAEIALEFVPSSPDEEIIRDELRATALLFQVRRLIEPLQRAKAGKGKAIERCAPCGDLIAAFMTSTVHGPAQPQNRLARILGSQAVARCRAQAQSRSRSRARRARLD